MRRTRTMLPATVCLVLLSGIGQSPTAAAEDFPPPAVPAGIENSISQADGQFRVFYRCEALEQDETTVSGIVVLAVENRSGQSVRELSARITDIAASPYGHFPIPLADLDNGQTKEVLVPFKAAKDEAATAAAATEVLWQLEYLDSAGTRVTVEVHGVMSI